ncbi:hypothetical protein Q4R63_00495, partial [Morganella morganii]
MEALKIYTNEYAEDKLLKLGLNNENITFAISSAISDSFRSSPLHPRIDAMSRAWREAVAAFRESVLLNDNGWTCIRSDSLELTVNSELGISVIITSGDKDTGLIDGNPRTKNAKGNAVRRAVEKNNYNLELFPSNDVFDDNLDELEAISTLDPTKTYVLLYYFDFSSKEVRCELSLPKEMTKFSSYNKIDTWSERIIITPVYFDIAIPSIFNDEGFSDDFDIHT